MQPDTSTTYLKQGQHLQRQGLLTEAEAAYRQAIELNPIFYGSFRYLGEVLVLQGKLDQAVEAYQRAKELNPKALWVHQGLGEVFLQLNKLEDAIACFQTAIEINPDFSWAYNGLGECWSLKVNRENAIAAYQKAVELNPDSDTFRHNLEKVLAEQELVSEEEITDKVEDSLELGKTLTEQGDFEEAIKYYRKACELNPNSFDAHYQLSVCLSQYTQSKLTVLESDPELGKVILQQLQEAHPDIDLSNLNDDAFLQALSEFSDQSFVRELYRAYLKRQPEPGATENWSHHIQNTSARKGLITEFRNTREFKNVLSRYGEENVQKDIAIHWKFIKVGREHLTEKIACYQRCLELNPYFYDLYYEYGQTLHRAGRTDEAILDYRQAIKIGCNLVSENRIEEALECYRKFLEILPEKQEIAYDLATKLVNCGKINELLCCYDQVFKLAKTSFNLYHNLALFLSKQNFIYEAVICFERVSKIQRLNFSNDQHLYEKIWNELNNNTLFSTTKIDDAVAIEQQEVESYFQSHSRYLVVSLQTLTEEQKLSLNQMGLIIDNLKLIAQDDFALEKIYINSFSDPQPELLSSQIRLTPPSYQQSLVETGYIYTICPFSGKVLRSNQSFVINHAEHPAKQRGHDLQGFCYRFLGKEIFYLIVGCPNGEKLLVYFPKLELIISLNNLIGFARPIESMNKLKSYMVSYWRQVKSYLSTEAKQVVNVIGLGFNIGHYVWQDLAGIDVLRENGILNKLDKIMAGPGDYFSCQDLFPEIPADKFMEVEDVSDVFKKVIDNNYVVLRVNGIFIKEQLIDRIRKVSYQKCSQEFIQQVEEAKKQCFPLLGIQIRAKNSRRIWLSQVEGIANIINHLYADYPKLGIVFDGWSITGKEDESSSCWSMIDAEKATMDDIVAAIPGEVPVYTAIGATTFETTVWHQSIGLTIASLGAGLLYPSWIANKPTVVHASIFILRGFQNAVTSSSYRENIIPPTLISPEYITDHQHNDYECNWQGIYTEVIKILQNLVDD
ncbi:tetratricopeptide repeat protein [Planktothrix agardhii]|uniref:tetratricopeptide repeat protein n=1 Tax=Planktothrix agardhii TaxID=1160 RepID=UPI002200FC78|nr:tetratricopeptide repeat protein [Planktothrix agardhii]CAD5945955.1 UDP-N-acetylglucosamine--peptide N-acetylglucosaminyltransferase 110 kDa subunit [Planktothrix agardhii]